MPPSLPTAELNGTNVFSLSNGSLTIKGVPLLSEVPSNVTFSPFASVCQSSDAPLPLLRRAQSHSRKGGFLGFAQAEPSHLLKNSLGRFRDRRFLSVFRFKTWWSTMWVGSGGSDLRMETQWVMFHVPELDSYAVLIPLVEGRFRSALHPGADGGVVVWAESGSEQVQTDSFRAISYVHFGDNPYTLMKEAFTCVRVHLDTCRLLEEKALPPIVDKFGWCTWDAFYLTVDPVGIWQGVKEFAEGGAPLRFLIIDDGWQSIAFDGGETKDLVIGGQQMTGRLYRLEECDKFRRYRAGSLLGQDGPSFDPARPKKLIAKAVELEHAEKARDRPRMARLAKELSEMCNEGVKADDSCGGGGGGEGGLGAFTRDLRTKFPGLDDIYVWQALCGAWGGVMPGATRFDSKVVPVDVSPGLEGTMDDLAVEKIEEGGLGLVRPDQAAEFYDAMHSYLSTAGITGVKVDVIHTLEYVCKEYGGRVELAKAYYKGLTESLKKNFNGTGLISSMQQCNDFFFLGTSQISLGRSGDDFWFQDPNGDPMGAYWLQGLHMIHCAYNSLWMGQFIQPDWDMFQSDHCCAKFHAGSRAICGGPIYLSDSVGHHDFDLIKRLVFPDGTIPKCVHFALPTRDCLFGSPLFDGETLLKIWNLNKFGGVIGAFNCQGAGWDPEQQRFRGFSHMYKSISGSVHVNDIEWDQKEETSDMAAAEEYAVYLNQAERLVLASRSSAAIETTLQPSSFEIFSFAPVGRIVGRPDVKFAPIGLTNMLNSGGTVCEVAERGGDGGGGGVRVTVKGAGRLLVYSSGRPGSVAVNGADVGFEWSADDGKLVVDAISWAEERGGMSEVVFAY
ncbi:stachyose synthase-like [Iris pallida]|uniref:Stachyose synthase-like n=1 Tax=Iris pallida TaxID=29817 RepID=A0AAX6GD50_IRIPA|nr:stachyose synthase-like [Iris pallida]